MIRKSTEQDNETVHRMLQKYNAAYMEEGRDFSYCIEEDAEILAGIVASSLFDTVEVEYLCVRKECRGKGYGRQLLEKVEEQAKEAGIRRIFLNTYSFQAPEFYKKMGYHQLFEIDPAFKSYSQFYFVKEL